MVIRVATVNMYTHAATHPSADQRAMNVEVLLVEDHVLFRQGLRALLADSDPTIKIVADTGSGEAALGLIPDLLPDVVLMDIHLPGMSGVEAISHLSEVCPAVRVLVLSGSADDEDVLAAILAGARGYLLKDGPIADIAAGIRTAARGGSVLSPEIAAQLLDHVRAGESPPSESAPTHGTLTPREAGVLRLMATGLENAAIGQELGIGTRTVRNHVASILEKLHMHNRIQAAVYAVKHGLA